MPDITSLIKYAVSAELAFIVMLLYMVLLIRNSHKSNRYFLYFLLSISFPLYGMAFSRLFPSFATLIFYFAIAVTSVSGAFIRLYIHSLSGRIPASRGRRLILFIPFPFFFTALVLMFPTAAGRPVFSHGIAVMGGLSLLVSTAYTVFSFIGIRKYSTHMDNWFSNSEKVSILWLKKITVLALVLFFLWDINMGMEVFGLVARNPVFPFFHLSIIALIIFIAAYHVVRQPYIFQQNSDIDMAMGSDDADSERTKVKYAKQSVSDDELKRYLSVLQEFMTREKPYLDADITIRKLSESLGIPIHHLSIVINSLCGKNFSTFINEYRIREALSSLGAQDNRDANILSIAFHSGFNSKSSFNSAFKKVMGKTPSEYRGEVV
jgi:AraC-like DNA-binding protein